MGPRNPAQVYHFEQGSEWPRAIKYLRAHRWFDELSTGKASSLAEIAAREGLAVRYVGRLIRLGFLAPDIVESIV